MLLGIIIFTGKRDQGPRWVYRLNSQIMIAYNLLTFEPTIINSWEGYSLERAFFFAKRGNKKLTLSTERHTTE